MHRKKTHKNEANFEEFPEFLPNSIQRRHFSLGCTLQQSTFETCFLQEKKVM